MIAIADMALVGQAQAAAVELAAKYPFVEFTSGRRSLSEQAQAMAGNVIFNRKWIAETYFPYNASKTCQAWVDANPDKKTLGDVSDGLFSILQKMSHAELLELSDHLVGLAFDVKPRGGVKGFLIRSAMERLAKKYGGRFLVREGGLTRWHIQFKMETTC